MALNSQRYLNFKLAPLSLTQQNYRQKGNGDYLSELAAASKNFSGANQYQGQPEKKMLKIS
jgi:hypothetical protein